MQGYDGGDILAVNGGRCSRCGRPLPFGGGLAEWLLCDTCLHAANADIAAKRSILLPQAARNADALSAVA
jgi:hypothetical protein